MTQVIAASLLCTFHLYCCSKVEIFGLGQGCQSHIHMNPLLLLKVEIPDLGHGSPSP